MRSEKYAINKNNLNEPYPMNLLLSVNDTPFENNPIDIENVTQDTIDGLHHALGLLPERHREIVRLRFEEKQTYAQIGEVMGVSLERIRFLVHDAMVKLRTPPSLFYIIYGKQGYEEIRRKSIEEKRKNIPTVMEMPLRDLDLSIRPENRLIAIGCKTVADVVALSKVEILNIKRLGDKSIHEVAAKLESLGITDSAWSRI